MLETHREDMPPPPMEFTEEMEEQREALLQEGFNKWTKRDFDSFVMACEQYGRDALQDIIEVMRHKKAEEVIAYSRRFWERIWDIDPQGKVVERIESGEEELQKLKSMVAMVMEKVERAMRSEDPWAALKVAYSKSDRMEKKLKVLR